MRVGLLAFWLLMVAAADVSAEWQIKPFIGTTFGGGTTFVDVENAVGGPNIAFGVNSVLLGEVLGIDGDLSYASGFFESGDRFLVVQSSVTTLAGNVVVALPRHLAEVGLRPYVVAGAGLMHVKIDHALGVLHVASTLPAVNVGGGVTGFLTDRLGLSWEVRHFRSIGKNGGRGLSFGREKLSFWRGTMAVAIRY